MTIHIHIDPTIINKQLSVCETVAVLAISASMKGGPLFS